MFKILELKGNSTQAAEVGRRHPRREEALAAVKKHLKTFKASGHNPEANIGGPEIPKACESAGLPASSE